MVNGEKISELQEEFTAKLLLLQCYACVIKKKGKCLHGYDELRVILRTSIGTDFKRSLPKWGKFAYSPPCNCKGGTTLFFVSLLELAHYTQALSDITSCQASLQSQEKQFITYLQHEESIAMKKPFLILGLLALMATLLLSVGCSSKGKFGKKNKDNPAEPDIVRLTFSLPEQIEWMRNSDPAMLSDGVNEWFMVGFTPETTPVRVMDQKIAPAQPFDYLKDQLLSSLTACKDSKVTTFNGKSKYADQKNIEAICSQMGNDNYGLITYLSIFNDGVASHLVMAEVRSPPAEKVGQVKFQGTKEQQAAAQSKRFADLLFQTMQTIKVCDSKGLCI